MLVLGLFRRRRGCRIGEHLLFGRYEQLGQLVFWERALQEEQVDRQGQYIAGG